jgi:hypothetical protein
METWRSMEKSILYFSFEDLQITTVVRSEVFQKVNRMPFSMDLHVSMVISGRECGVI